MDFFSRLTAHQADTVIRLPYRVGLWVSRSDRTGGTEANLKELEALSAILHGFAEETFGAEIVQHIISATIRKKDEWLDWRERLETVPGECRDAMDILREHASVKDAAAFRNHIMEIAEAVAIAFREESGGGSMFGAAIRYLGYVLFGKSGNRAVSFREFANISADERKALAAIAQALEAA